ncbi:MAG: DUF2842 domain-containing protein [Caulobacter sp.]|nr:DUF2842 domain-containing protein [Caulobacter sp.]
MTPRLKKFVGMVAIVVFLAAYAAAAMLIADHLYDHPAVRLIYFVVVGTAWGLPLFPLLTWMNRDGPR